MKTTCLSLALSMFLFSCKKEEACSSQEKVIAVDLQGMFNRDAVRVVLDGTEVYRNDTLQNDLRLGLELAAAPRFSTSTCAHTLKVIVNGLDSSEVGFHRNADVYVGVSYKRAGKVVLTVQDTPFLYL
jgi:hypothetical protein